MKLNFSESDEFFRREVRSFFASTVPLNTREKMKEGRELSKAELVEWQRILNRKGWAVAHWPTEYGGTGWTAVQQYIFNEEMQLAPAPSPVVFGVNMVGPVIYTFGNQDQKAFFLPRIANIDDWWCQGFSEPGSGSDLASLRTSAKRQGDIYIVNGQKTWTSYAQYADWMFCLARTDPDVKPQSGISFLLIDMKSPGITVRPLQLIDGTNEVNEVFFDDVEVPIENLVGEEGKGWDYAKFLLGNERSSLARTGVMKSRLNRIRELAGYSYFDGKPLSDDVQFRCRLASLEIEIKALELTVLRVLADPGPEGRPNPVSSILKIRGSDLLQATTELLLDVVGPHSARFDLGASNNEAFSSGSEAAANYFNFRKLSIYGGSNEIQRNIIAKAILGL